MSKFKPYNHFLKTLISPRNVREMNKQTHSTPQRKTRTAKRMGDLWQCNPILQENLRIAVEV